MPGPGPETSPTDRLRRVASALAAGRPPDEADARPVGEALLGWLDGGDLEKGLGLAGGAAGPSWRRRGRWAERNRLVAELARLYEGAPAARASALARDLRLYTAAGWPRDRDRGEPCPPSQPRALMFAIHAADPDRPPPTGRARLLAIIREAWSKS